MQVRDAVGIGLSGACVAHCLALPVLVSVTPALVPLQSEFVHLGFATLALLTLVSAVRRWPEGLLGLVIQFTASFAVAGLFLAVIAAPSEEAETLITVASAVSLALSHIAAWWFARRHSHTDNAPRTCA
jgi:hypothetical protein